MIQLVFVFLWQNTNKLLIQTKNIYTPSIKPCDYSNLYVPKMWLCKVNLDSGLLFWSDSTVSVNVTTECIIYMLRYELHLVDYSITLWKIQLLPVNIIDRADLEALVTLSLHCVPLIVIWDWSAHDPAEILIPHHTVRGNIGLPEYLFNWNRKSKSVNGCTILYNGSDVYYSKNNEELDLVLLDNTYCTGCVTAEKGVNNYRV